MTDRHLISAIEELKVMLAASEARNAQLVDALQAAHDKILLGLLSLGFNKAEGDSSAILTKIETALATLDVPDTKEG